MNLPQPLSVTEIADLIGAEIMGNPDVLVTGINEIHRATEGDLTFVDIPKYMQMALNSEASVVIINERVEVPVGKTLLYCKQPFFAYNSLVGRYRPLVPLTQEVHPTAEVHPSVILEPHVVVGAHAKIGEGCHIQANVYIGSYTEIGKNTIIKPNAIIGSDAFYFKKDENNIHHKWTSGGQVIIGNNVYIGAGCTIDKGVSGNTIIGNGTKFDNLIHIGHDVEIGENCLFAAQVGIGGMTIIEDNVTVYGQVGIAQNIRIGKGTTVLAKSGVAKNFGENKTLFGLPAQEATDAYRQMALLRSFSHDRQKEKVGK